jgi:endo-1,4-beta-mannosidase
MFRRLLVLWGTVSLGACGGATAPLDMPAPRDASAPTPDATSGVGGSPFTVTDAAATGGGGFADVSADAAPPADVIRGPVPINRIGVDGAPYFLNGINLAWNNWSSDLSAYDDAVFTDVFTNLEQAGGNALRLWIHIDGSQTPVWDAQGMPTGMPYGSEENLTALLDNAASHHVKVLLALWSFDLITSTHTKVVTDAAATHAYADLVLPGLVTAAMGNAGLLGWEICNEPQFMTEGYVGTGLPKSDVLRFHAIQAAAIHRIDPSALVTTGDMIEEISPTLAGTNHYSDAALAAAAGNDPLARFDFYEMHNYGMRTRPKNPWQHDASFYGLDKPLIIGEFEAAGVSGWSPSKMYLYALDHGYAGALSWAYLDNRADHSGTFADAKPGIAAVFAQVPDAIRP